MIPHNSNYNKPTLLINSIDASDGPFLTITDFFIGQYEVIPSPTYKEITNDTTDEVFPNCCDYHKALLSMLNEWFDKFPNCCKEHKAMVGKWWYHRSNYENLPIKVITQLAYTVNILNNEIDKNDWYESITDFIEYNIKSFGTPGVGSGLYVNELKKFIQNSKAIQNAKIKSILVYLNAYNKKPSKHQEETDLNMLHSTYQKWLKTFPFSIEYFKDVKERFEKDLPIIKGGIKINRYSGVASAKLLTRTELILLLTNKTIELLAAIDTVELIKQGIVADTDKHVFELINQEHKIKQADLLKQFTEAESQYVVILNRWLTNEKLYFQSIEPYLKNRTVSNPQIKIYPVFKKEIIADLLLILRDFFELDQQSDLEELINTGNNKSKKTLLFKDNGNRLTDGFRQLKDKDLISGCQKKDLEKWIRSNFEYLSKKKPQIFTADYVEKCISRNTQPCKNPLFSIINGNLIKK